MIIKKKKLYCFSFLLLSCSWEKISLGVITKAAKWILSYKTDDINIHYIRRIYYDCFTMRCNTEALNKKTVIRERDVSELTNIADLNFPLNDRCCSARVLVMRGNL